MAGDADPAELSLTLRSNKRPPYQSPPWLVAPSASTARHLHRAVTTDATVAKRYTCPDDSPTAGAVERIDQYEMRVLMPTRRTINRSGYTTAPGQPG